MSNSLGPRPWTIARQAPPSVGFSRQEYWSGLPLPSPWDLPHPGIEPRSAGRHFNLWATRINRLTIRGKSVQLELRIPSWSSLCFLNLCGQWLKKKKIHVRVEKHKKTKWVKAWVLAQKKKLKLHPFTLLFVLDTVLLGKISWSVLIGLSLFNFLEWVAKFCCSLFLGVGHSQFIYLTLSST